MARSMGGGSRSGGSRRSSSSRSRSGGGSSSSPSTSKFYSSKYRHRHHYVNRRGKTVTYFSEDPLDFSKTPQETRKNYRSFISIMLLPLLLVLLVSTSSIFFTDFKNLYKTSTPIKAYSATERVMEDNSVLFTPEEDANLEKALREFGETTGIIPYVYTTDSMDIDGFIHSDIEDYSLELYYRLFTDENHLLITYVNKPDWEWWATQGDNTYPLYDDDEFEIFQERLQKALIQNQPVGQALTDTFTGFGKTVVSPAKQLKSILLNITILSVFFGIPLLIVYFSFYKQPMDQYTDEYNSYMEYGMPIQPDMIYEVCPSCGEKNPTMEEECKNCHTRLVKI